MPIYTLSDLRRVAGQAGVTGSDEFLIKDYADRAGLDPVHVANKLGYDGGASTLTKERIAGGIDNYQSGWWETGAALANGLGLDGVKNYAERKAADNRFQAEVAGARARQLGGIDSYEDVDGVSSGLNYLGGLAAQAIPYAAEAAVGGWVGRGIGATAKGLQLASRAGRAADATQDVITAGRAAETALGRRGMVGATVASYPSSVGDILGNQREQIEANGGEMDYGSAFVGGVPYSLLNGALGIEGTLGRGQMARSGVRLLDDMTGIRGIAARTGASVGRQMAEEGTSELGQEFVNQYFGRMAVDPNETFYNDESGKRFRESFVGGAALGGAFGAVGGHRRSQDYYDRQRTPNPDQSTPREDSYEEPGPVRQLGYSPLAGTPIVFPDGTVTLDGEQELQARFPNQVEPVRGLNTARVGVASDPSINVDRAGTAATNYDDTQALQDLGAELGRQRYLEQAEHQKRIDEIKRNALARAEEIKLQENAAGEFGIKGSKGVGLFVELTGLHKDGTITDGELSENLALLSNRKNGAVDRWIRATVEHRANQAEVSKAEIEAPINNLKAQAEAKNVSKRVPNVAQAPVDGGRGGVVDAGSQPAGGPGVVPGAVGSADTTAGTPAPGATGVAVRAGGGGTGAVSPGMKLVAGLEKRNGRALTQQEKTRLFLAAGLDSAGFPVGRKLTYDEVAAVESDQSGGKQVKRAAISKQMLGIGVSEKLIHAFADRVSASNADETDTINDAVETDDGVLAVQDQPEFDTKPTADEVSFGAAAQQMVDTGMQVQAGTAMSGAGGTAREIVKNLRLLLGDKNSNLSEPQRKAIGLVITSDANLDSADGEKAEQTATRVIKRAQQLLQRTDVFSPGELAVLKAVVGSTKGENVEARTRSVVEEKREEAKGPDPELVARNEAIIAQNAKRIEEFNADLTEEGELRSKAELVREIIGPEPDTNTIADAASSWDEDLSAGDPKWVTLSAVEQGGWINTWVAYETGELNAQGLAREYGAQLDQAKLRRANGQADADTGKPAVAAGGAVPGGRTRSAVEQNLPVGPSDAGEKGSFAGAETQAGTGNRPVTPPTITVKKRRTIVKPEPDGTKFSTDRAGSGSTVDEIYAEFAELGIRPNNRKVTVVQSVADVPQSMRKSVDNKSKVTASRVAAFVSGDRAWFIADNIAPGTGRALFMHEVGMHLGAENLLTEDQLDNLFSTIIKWADRNDGTMESNLARQAIIRAGVAVTHDEQLQSEVMAYFVEEAVKAGIDPTAMSYKNELARWFRALYAAFKSAIRKLGWTNAADKLTAQDIVDLAYGAAKLEMDGTFHGTAAQFRKFNHAFMGSGEGAQAYGWGSYLAQRPGIAKGYWKADVARKGVGDPRNATYDGAPSRALSQAVQNHGWGVRNYGVRWMLDREAEALDNLAPWEGNPKLSAALRRMATELRAMDPDKVKVAPDGALMRVDVNVTDDELLDWDKPLSEQSEVVKDALREAGLVDDIGWNPLEKHDPYFMMGEELYQHYQNRLGSKKAASEYLDSIGIKGIKFLDAESRGWEGAKFKIVEAGPYRTHLEKTKPWIVEIENGGGYLTMNFRTRGEAEAWVENVKSGVTRNLVIFNDKNIYRVASAVGADRGRMKFSVDAAVKTNDTAVDSYIRKVAGRSGVQLKTNLQHQAKKLVRSMAFLHDLVDEYKGAMPAVADWYNAIQSTMARKRQLEADAELIAADALKLKNGTDKVNAFIADATTSQKWWKDVERQKDGNTVKVEANPELKERFRQLEPEERKIVEAVFAHGDKMLEIKYQLLKDLGLDGVMLGTGKLIGPYAPLKRFGNYVTVLKSQALVDAEMAEDAVKAEELKKDPANYVVSFFDTLGQARMFAEDHSGKYAFTDYGEKQVRLGEDLPTHNATLKRILDTIKVQNLPDEARVGMENLIREMYIQSLDEHHAATHGLTRKNTAGYETDMLRSFLSHARAEANFLAHLEYGGKVNNAFYEMQRQSRDRPGGKVVHRDALAALTRHYAENLNYKETPIQDRLMAFTSAWQLATSLGYHVANATQPVMTTVPRLASDFNDYAGAWKAVMDGYQTVKKTGVWGNIEIDKVLDSGLRTALQRAADLGVLDVGMDEDLTHFEQTHTGFGAVDKASKVAKTALHNMRKVSRAVETANRVAAATAAYNMAKKHGMAEQAAQDYAVRMLETTQGDFSRSGAPLLLKKLPKIMTQYKKFQFMMMALYAKAFVQVFHGVDLVKLTKDNSPEAKQIRAIGRRMLAFKLFHTSMAAGALGLPMVNLAGPVLARMLAGDEEPPDLERDLRKIIGDETMADMLLHGPLHFMGMDAKLGEEKIFSILPYADWDFSSASGALKTAAGLAGPAVSLGLKFASGVEAFENGDIYKGVEKFMPSGAANALKAFRVANEGYTLKNGDVMFAPDDINGAALAFDFFGLPSSDMKRMDWLRGQQYELTQFYKDRTKAIAKQYTDAVKEGDTDQASDAREAWMELQASKDRLRYLFGDSADELKRQPLSALMKYPKNQAEREQRLQRAAVVP